MSTRRRQRLDTSNAREESTDIVSQPRVVRPRRMRTESMSTARVSRTPQSIRLTVKTSSSKLREATRSNMATSGARSARDPFIGGEIVQGKRARNVKKSYVLESESDEDVETEDPVEDDVESGSIEEDEDEEVEEDEEEDEDAEDDGLGDEDAEGDIDMDEAPPPPPVIKVSKTQSGGKSIVVKPPSKVDHKTVEQKEVEADSDDEELSDLESDIAEEEEAMQTGNEDETRAEADDMEIEEGGDDDEDIDELDSDDETPADGSRASTPDLSKLTKRQRARIEEGGSGHLLALPDEVQVKKHLTAEEHAMRRAEMARRRKNLSEKRNEEEKMETINKLLKKQAPKTNARRNLLNNVASDSTPDSENYKPNHGFVRWISSKDGNRIGVPEEWVDSPIGDVFKASVKPVSNTTDQTMAQQVS